MRESIKYMYMYSVLLLEIIKQKFSVYNDFFFWLCWIFFLSNYSLYRKLDGRSGETWL